MKKPQKIWYLNSFKVNHSVFDHGFVHFLGICSTKNSELPYLLSCVHTILRIRFLKGTIILGSFSNWMILFMPSSRRFMYVVHNNLERRFVNFLKPRQHQLLLTYLAQKDVLNAGIYIGHPVLDGVILNKPKEAGKALLFSNDRQIGLFVENEITRHLYIKGAIGISYISNLYAELLSSEFLIIDRKYLLRNSSLISLGIAHYCKVVVTCDETRNLLNYTYETDKIVSLRDWEQAVFFTKEDVDRINFNFQLRIRQSLLGEY